MTPTEDEPYIAAQRLVAEGDLAAAVTLYEARVALDPADPVAWRRLAALQTNGGDLAAGLLSAGRAIKLDPLGMRGHLVRGWILLQQRQFQLALADLERAAAIDPTAPDALVMLAHAVLAAEVDYARARSLLEQAAAIDPGNPLVVRLARLLRTGRVRGLIVGAHPAASAGTLILVGGILAVEPPAPGLYWTAGCAGLFVLLVIGTSVAARLRLAHRPAGPAALAGFGVGAAMLAGAAGYLGTGSVATGLVFEGSTAALAALCSIQAVRVWRRSGRRRGPREAV